MFSSNGFRPTLSAAALVSADAPDSEEGESRNVTLVKTDKGLAVLKAHLSSIGLSQSVFYSRIRAAKKEEGFVSPFAEMGPGLQTIDASSEHFAESDGGGRAGKYVCVFADAKIVEVAEADLAATKLLPGYVTCVRVSGRWCLETETMTEKYPELKRKPKGDDATATDAVDAAPEVTPEVVDAPKPAKASKQAKAS